MHRLFIVLALFLFFSAAIPGKKISNFRTKDINNHWQEYKHLKGNKLTVIDFWATWCKPCVQAIPKLVTLADKYKEKGVSFISINVDGNRNRLKIKPMAHSLGINFPILLDVNGQIKNQLAVMAIPTLLIVNQNDEVLFFHQGYRVGDEKIVEQRIQEFLHED
ncbi:MAG: TlpA family protein disulfide reductase [Deferribacteres bacterium]|nr:TlpA family protein disulfide reductase [candidate division KSB1 bacterium]MCB9500980.1 TlpA family protein disulfide reductase [Deferribacteres bacterium]